MGADAETASLTSREILWRTKIFVKVVLSQSDVSSLDTPPPLYLQVSRQSYLHSHIPDILPLWHHVLPPGDRTPWFEFNSLPLKWNLPAGVLYDLLVPTHDQTPWPLTLHFTGYPSAATTSPSPTSQIPPILPYSGEKSLNDSLMNSLKESGFVCCGTAQHVMQMVGKAQEDLTRAVTSTNPSLHADIMTSLHMESTSARSIPTKIFIRENIGARGGYLSSYHSILQTSHSGVPTATLYDAMLPFLRAWLSSLASPGGSAGLYEDVHGEGAGAGAGEDVWNQVERVWVGGVEPPKDSSLRSLHETLHGPDFFLYIVLICKARVAK